MKKILLLLTISLCSLEAAYAVKNKNGHAAHMKKKATQKKQNKIEAKIKQSYDVSPATVSTLKKTALNCIPAINQTLSDLSYVSTEVYFMYEGLKYAAQYIKERSTNASQATMNIAYNTTELCNKYLLNQVSPYLLTTYNGIQAVTTYTNN